MTSLKGFKSLKTTIVLSLVVPVVVFIVIESLISYYVTLHYVEKVYDRWLLDSAHALTQDIKIRDQSVVVDMPEPAMRIFRWDDVDTTYFKVIVETGEVLAGDSFVPEAPMVGVNWRKPVFFNANINGSPVRGVSILVNDDRLPYKVFVHVAETLKKRREMMRDILLADLVPQLAMALLIIFFLYHAVKYGLKPLKKLAGDIALRSPQDLSLIPESKVFIEVKALTDRINDLLAKLSFALESQQKFIANAAHQLRTPLAGLKLQVERAQRERDVDAMQPALQQIRMSVDRSSHMVSQLLVLAKSEAGRGSACFESVDFNQLVREVCIDWVPKALKKRQELSFYGLERAFLQNINAVLFRELLGNLLANAIEYGREGGAIDVTLSVDNVVRLLVEDDGKGIPAEDRERVFERFYQIPKGTGTGCGLGMAIVKEIADLHGAEVMIGVSGLGGAKIELIWPASGGINTNN